MKIQDTINKVVELVKDSLKEDIPKEQKQHILCSVEDLGYQWQNTNASHRTTLVAVGMMQHGENEEVDLDDKGQLEALEQEGATKVIQELSMPVYASLVQDYLEQADALQSITDKHTGENL